MQGMDDSRVTLTGMVEVLSGAEEKAARELYRKRHPDSFWIDFGDFEPFRMTSISKVRLNGGFARAATVAAVPHGSLCMRAPAVLANPFALAPVPTLLPHRCVNVLMLCPAKPSCAAIRAAE